MTPRVDSLLRSGNAEAIQRAVYERSGFGRRWREMERVTCDMKCFNVHCAEGFLYTPRENDVYPRETYTRERPRMQGSGVVAEPPDANTSPCHVANALRSIYSKQIRETR